MPLSRPSDRCRTGRHEPIVVDDITGRELKEQWVGGITDEVVEFEGVSFSLKAILRIKDKWNPGVSRERDMDRNTAYYRGTARAVHRVHPHRSGRSQSKSAPATWSWPGSSNTA